jgi:pectinesterase
MMFSTSHFLSLAVVALSLLTTSIAAPTELVKRTARDSTPSGCLTVRGSGTKSGEYSTVGAALTALGTSSTAAACIFIYTGTYTEQITINYKGALTLYGYTAKYVFPKSRCRMPLNTCPAPEITKATLSPSRIPSIRQLQGLLMQAQRSTS